MRPGIIGLERFSPHAGISPIGFRNLLGNADLRLGFGTSHGMVQEGGGGVPGQDGGCCGHKLADLF